MIKKIVSALTCAAVLCVSLPTSLSAGSASMDTDDISFSDIPADEYFYGDEIADIFAAKLHMAKDVPKPEEIPVDENLAKLDPRVIKIKIDPGHYSYYNKSPVYPSYWESVMTWKLSNYLRQELWSYGVYATLTKGTLEEDVGLNERGFRSKGYDFFISMHSNAGGSASTDQPLAFCYQNLPWTDIDDISREVGALIAQTTSTVMGTTQKGAIEQRKGTADHDKNGSMDDEWYSVLFASRYVGTPGILMEHSFHTNYRSAVWLSNDDNLKALAKAEAKVLYDYFHAKKLKDYPPLPTQAPTQPPTQPHTLKPRPKHDVYLGDVNTDDAVDSVDASIILKAYSLKSTGHKLELTDEQFEKADANGDQAVDSVDASLILMYYAAYSTYRFSDSFEEFLILVPEPPTYPDIEEETTNASATEPVSESLSEMSTEPQTAVTSEEMTVGTTVSSTETVTAAAAS